MDNLSVYEFEQIHAISAWKSERPSRVGSLVGGLFGPLAPWVAPAVTRSVLEQAVAELATVGAIKQGMTEVARSAKVSDVRQLRFSPLKECDSLAARVTMTAQRDQLVQDALRRKPSHAAMPSPIPLPLLAAVRFICRIGHCYGYVLDSPSDRQFVLGILDSSMTPERALPWREQGEIGPARSGAALRRLMPFNGTTAAMKKSIARSPARRSTDRLVLDHIFLHRVDAITRRSFQERWLIDNGKTDSIAPALPRRRSALEDMNRAMSEMAYLVGGAIGFGAVFPVTVLCELLARGEHAGARGVRDGARAAVTDADEFLAGLLGRDPPVIEPRRSRAIGPLSP
jgi:hypothetical protein